MPIPTLGYIQNLRLATLVLVIAHHAGQTYGPTGGDWPVFHDRQAAWLGTFFSVNAGFFMALFFLIAGYFTANGLRRDGPVRLVARRAARLGPPALLVGFVLVPGFFYISGESGMPFAAWYASVYIGDWQVTFAHTWFLIHLLVYTVGAACLARQLRRPPVAPVWSGKVTAALLLLLVAVAGSTWLVRHPYPIDRWVTVGFVFPMEPAHLPQYLAAFGLGVWGGRVRLFETMPRRTSLAWLTVGVVAAVTRYGVDLIPAAGSDADVMLIAWRRALWPLWETVICFGLCLGLPVLFRTFLPACPPLVGRLADVTLTAYVVHVFVLVPLQMALLGSSLSPDVLFLIVTIAGAAVTFALALAWSAVAGRLAHRAPLRAS